MPLRMAEERELNWTQLVAKIVISTSLVQSMNAVRPSIERTCTDMLIATSITSRVAETVRIVPKVAAIAPELRFRC